MPFVGKALQRRDARVLIFIGVVALGAAFVMISHFDNQTSVGGMFLPLLVRGLAMSCLFVPINTVVLVEFSGAAIGEAAGMLNLMRQLGGSIGIAYLSTTFQENQVRFYSYLSEHTTWFDGPAIHAQRMLEGGMHGKMTSWMGLGTYPSEALKILFFRAKQQAFVLSFQKTMFTAVVFFMLVLIPLFLMKKPKKRGAVASSH